MPDATLEAVLSCYGLESAAVRHIGPLANAGGWSGCRLWRIRDATGGDLCLRRWPVEHPSLDRLRLIHAVLRSVATDLPVVAYPLPTAAGNSYVERGGHFWEMTHWKPGAADYHANPTRERLKAAMQVLARFHELAARYKTCRGRAPALEDRVRLWLEMKDRGTAIIGRALAVPLSEETDRRAARLFASAQRALNVSAIPGQLAELPELWLQPAIRDVHHDHVLFLGDEVTGLIDFGALRIDTPLADVARLMGSLVADERAERDFALDAYSEMRSLSESDRHVIEVFDETGVVLGALNWLRWLYVERRDMGPAAPIVRRLDEILNRLKDRADHHLH
jgi:homoserine kinase type II